MVKNRFKISIILAVAIVLFGGCSNQPDTNKIEKIEIKKTPKKIKYDEIEQQKRLEKERRLEEQRIERIKQEKLKKQKIIDSVEKDFQNKISKLYNSDIEGYKDKVIKFSDNLKSWIDLDTHLIWEVKTKQNIEYKYKWKDAKNYCSNLVLDGYSNWRLPNIDELKTLLAKNKYNDYYIKKPLSANINDYYWSATTVVNNTGNAWEVDFYYGNVYNSHKANSRYVRCVRVGGE